MKVFFAIIIGTFLFSCNSSSEANRGYVNKTVNTMPNNTMEDTLFGAAKNRVNNTVITPQPTSSTVPNVTTGQQTALTPEQMQQMQQQFQQQQMQQHVAQQVPANVSTKNGPINPAHGQPGHRCDIAVGAPLNGAAVKVNPTLVKGNQPTNITTTTPVKVNAGNATAANVPAIKTAPGMNPPHGEAGHRCDIAVGQPLSTKKQAIADPANPIGDIVPKF